MYIAIVLIFTEAALRLLPLATLTVAAKRNEKE